MVKKRYCMGLTAMLFFGLVLFLGAGNNAFAADLIVNGSITLLHGDHEYDDVVVINGGMIVVLPYNALVPGSGALSIKAENIYVDAGSSIRAIGSGYQGVINASGAGPGGGQGGALVWDGGGGGGYGGKGGDGMRDYWIGGVDGLGGPAYGFSYTMSIMMGSAGGSAGTKDGDYGGKGGAGGGALTLEAQTIEIDGMITADGKPGYIYGNDASGGGSGGGILLIGGYIMVDEGILRANGACGGQSGGTLDDGGGGGSGGRIKIFYKQHLDVDMDRIFVLGGCGTHNAEDGQPGSYYQEKIIIDAVVDFKPNTLNLSSKGKYVTVYIELPEGYDVAEIDVSTVLLNGTVLARTHPTKVGDYDSDGIPDLKVKFSRPAVQAILAVGDPVEVEITGDFYDDSSFAGSDYIRVIDKGKK